MLPTLSATDHHRLSTSFAFAVSFSVFFSSSFFSLVFAATASSSSSAASSAFSAAAANDDDAGTLLFPDELLLPPLLLLLLSRFLFFFFRRSSLFLCFLFTIPRPAPSAVELTPTAEAAARWLDVGRSPSSRDGGFSSEDSIRYRVCIRCCRASYYFCYGYCCNRDRRCCYRCVYSRWLLRCCSRWW